MDLLLNEKTALVMAASSGLGQAAALAFVSTDRMRQLLAKRAKANGTTVEAEEGKIVANIPLSRVCTVEDFGHTIAWLASPIASFMHGHALILDGGQVKSPL